MIQSLKEIKNRIRSIDSTKKVMRAMEMISLSKLRPVEGKLVNFSYYFSKMDGILNNLLSSNANENHPFLTERKENAKIAVCVITSDSGLCSTYNREIIRAAEAFINQYKQQDALLVLVGKKGFSYFKKKGWDIVEHYNELHGRYSDDTTEKIFKTLTGIFLRQEVSEVYIAYTHFISAARHRPSVEKFLNISPVKTQERNYILEPGINDILKELLPVYLEQKIKLILLNAFTCEHSARALAMGEATHNAEDLLDSLVLARNKMRQANITREIMEIISSTEVLR